MQRKYPFSIDKHAHDIEFRISRTINVMNEVLNGDKAYNEAEFDALESLLDRLEILLETALSSSRDGSVALLCGEDYKLAKECAVWAAEARESTSKLVHA